MYAERKFKLAMAALGLITIGWIVSGQNKVLNESFSELVTGTMGVLVLYYTGNVGSKFVQSKYTNTQRVEIVNDRS